MKNIIQKFSSILCALSVFIACSAQAWGPVGHRAIALIAEAGLNQKTKAEVAKILGTQSMADVANWADQVRYEKTHYLQTGPYHYEDIDDGVNYINHLAAMSPADRKKGGVVEAIAVAISYLRSPKTPPQDRLDAMKFLIHFVGDLHQPLHTGRPEDVGGNAIPVNWFGYSTNLHSIWDSGILLTGHQDIIKAGTAEEPASKIYARYLYTTYQHTPVQLGIDIERWLNESMFYRPYAYQKNYQTDQAAYLKTSLPIVDFRVYEAGVRLAYVLNQIYNVGTMETPETSLWVRTQAVVGSLFNIISFKP